MLKQLVEKHGSHGRWEDIARELPTSRTVSQCFSHYQSLQNNKAVKQKWTKEDDEALRNAVRQIGDRNWQQIAAMLGNKTGQQCLQRWHKSINPAIRRCRWTQQEDAALMAAVQVYGVGNWNKVQRHIAGRTDMQCRERYTNALDPSLTRDPMTDEVLSDLGNNEYIVLGSRKYCIGFCKTRETSGRSWTEMVRDCKALPWPNRQLYAANVATVAETQTGREGRLPLKIQTYREKDRSAISFRFFFAFIQIYCSPHCCYKLWTADIICGQQNSGPVLIDIIGLNVNVQPRCC